MQAPPSLARATESLRSRLARLWSSRRFRLVVRALALGWILFFWLWLIGAQSNFGEVDAEAYWGFTLDELYRDVQLGDQDAFLYSPVVAYLFLPFSALPWEVFYAILAAVNLAALVWILRPELAALSLFLVPVSNEVARGNIHILIAAAIVLGFRYYGAWAWVILTKVTPGIGVLWFAVRREWRSLAIALGVTGAIVAVSFVLTPELWIRWFEVLTAQRGDHPPIGPRDPRPAPAGGGGRPGGGRGLAQLVRPRTGRVPAGPARHLGEFAGDARGSRAPLAVPDPHPRGARAGA